MTNCSHGKTGSAFGQIAQKAFVEMRDFYRILYPACPPDPKWS
jgi:hypothetical protein